MESDVKRLCDIKSLRELRIVQRENEVAKMAAAGRVKAGIDKVFSLSKLLVLFTQYYVSPNVKRFLETIFRFSK